MLYSISVHVYVCVCVCARARAARDHVHVCGCVCQFASRAVRGQCPRSAACPVVWIGASAHDEGDRSSAPVVWWYGEHFAAACGSPPRCCRAAGRWRLAARRVQVYDVYPQSDCQRDSAVPERRGVVGPGTTPDPGHRREAAACVDAQDGRGDVRRVQFSHMFDSR